MFKPTTQQLMVEIKEAEKVRDEHLTGVNRIIREYVGRWYRGPKDWGSVSMGLDGDDINPEPYTYSFISNILPSLIFDNPSVVVEANRVIGHQMVQQAMQGGIRALIHDIRYKREAEKCVVDFTFIMGILMHYIEDDERWSAGAVRPNCKRIDYQMFGADSLATCEEDAEFFFHKYYVDIDDLQADPMALPEALEELQPSYGEPESAKKEPFTKGDAAALGRKRICLYSVWIRRTNTIRVIAEGSKPVEIYEERDYYGPKTGPYSFFRAYPVPGQFWPLSPLIAVQDQVIDLNVHARATSRSAAGRKTVIIVDGTLSTLADDIKHSEDREVLSIPGFNSSQCQQIELGGVTNHQYQYLGFLRDRLDRHSGLTETSRGNTGAADSATEASIANEALNNRTEYLKGRVRQGIADSLTAMGWFLFHTTGIIIPVTIRDPLTGMPGEGLFFGGPIPGQETGTWYDYTLKIEPLSIQRVSEQTIRRNAMELANFIIATAPMIPQMPYIKWLEIFKMVGESMNQENAEGFLIPELLGMMSAPQLQPVSTALGQNPTNEYPPRYFSMPGMGFKAKPGAGMPSGHQPELLDRRQEFGKEFGKIGGGMQGPPGSASGY